MKFNELLQLWKTTTGEQPTASAYAIHLPLHQAARIHALAEMFPGRNETQIITDLLGVALNELESRLPYVAGQQVIAEDEFGDPLYEDVGLTPRFTLLTNEHARQLETEIQANDRHSPETDTPTAAAGVQTRDEGARRHLVESVHSACLQKIQTAYEQASISGLCGEGAWECAVSAMRHLDVDTLLKPDEAQPD